MVLVGIATVVVVGNWSPMGMRAIAWRIVKWREVQWVGLRVVMTCATVTDVVIVSAVAGASSPVGVHING